MKGEFPISHSTIAILNLSIVESNIGDPMLWEFHHHYLNKLVIHNKLSHLWILSALFIFKSGSSAIFISL